MSSSFSVRTVCVPTSAARRTPAVASCSAAPAKRTPTTARMNAPRRMVNPTERRMVLVRGTDKENSGPPGTGEVDVDLELDLDTGMGGLGGMQKGTIGPPREEKFAVLDTGIWECKSCAYEYNESKGDAEFPVAAGTPFRALPDDYECPTCGAGKTLFVSRSREVAGFAENQGYGLGTNAMTGDQKSLLIYGGLFIFFGLFIGGYLLD